MEIVKVQLRMALLPEPASDPNQVQLRMESFHSRCRIAISVCIKNLKAAMQ